MTQPLKLAIIGPWGRMGRRVFELATSDSEVVLHSVLVRDVDEKDGRRQELPEGCILTDKVDEALAGADALIDFTAPAVCSWLAPKCVENKVAYVLASTGLSVTDQAVVNDGAKSIPVLEEANFSFGVNVLLGLVQAAAAQLDGFDVEISEIHHKIKRDAPSGTAYALGKAVHAGRSGLEDVTGRAGVATRKDNELGYAALRGGDVAGEHTVFFFGDGERIELTHRATTPNIFASGALKAAKWLVGKAPGRYSMRDVISN